jgi:hypothetical protein
VTDYALRVAPPADPVHAARPGFGIGSDYLRTACGHSLSWPARGSGELRDRDTTVTCSGCLTATGKEQQ